jgi:ATP-dependent Lon protease
MINVHLHLPANAQKKDGPRVGVAMVCSALLGVGILQELGAKTTVGGLIQVCGIVSL